MIMLDFKYLLKKTYIIQYNQNDGSTDRSMLSFRSIWSVIMKERLLLGLLRIEYFNKHLIAK